MLSWLSGIGGKILMGLSLMALLGGGLTVAIRAHDRGVLALAQVSQDKAIQAAQADASAHEIQALQDQEAKLRSDAAISAALKVKTHAVPQTTACALSPAVRALVAGVRGDRGANGSGARASGAK